MGTLQANKQPVCGLYGAEARYEGEDAVDAAAPGNMAERLALFGVSVPGESPWAHQLLAGQSDEDVAAALGKMAIHSDEKKAHASERTPIPEQPSITALLKLADVDKAEQLRTTEVVDVVGLLDLSFIPNPDLPLGDESTDAAVPQLPCIHALFFDKATERTSLLPLLEHAAVSTPRAYATPLDARAALIAHLAEHLGGDALAAEFLLLALLAKMYVARLTQPYPPPWPRGRLLVAQFVECALDHAAHRAAPHARGACAGRRRGAPHARGAQRSEAHLLCAQHRCGDGCRTPAAR